jgi:SAM-dependent methyltransferase
MEQAETLLLPLRVCNVCNTSDTQVIENIRSALARGLPSVQPYAPLKEKPLVILASGPSGPEYLEKLLATQCEFDLMALNGAYNKALELGLVPTHYAQLDARAVNTNFLSDPRKETKFYLASQVHPDVYEQVSKHDVTVFHLNTPAARETVPPPAIFFGGNGGTIGSSSLALACELGYRHLILVGFDSSLARSGASHSRYQPQNANQALLDVWLGDQQYWTTPALADQVMGFFEWTNVLHRTYEGLVIDTAGEGLFYDWIKTNQNIPSADGAEEAKKYIDAYKDPHYRMSAHRRAMIRDIIGLTPGKSLLDVGTGHGETLREAQEQGKLAKGTETVPVLLNENVVYALLPNLPFGDDEFDIVTSFEVLEHLLPADVVPALQELARVAKSWVVVSVCTQADVVGGVNLHPSARSEEEWHATFREAFGADVVAEFCGNASTLGVSPIYRFRVA